MKKTMIGGALRRSAAALACLKLLVELGLPAGLDPETAMANLYAEADDLSLVTDGVIGETYNIGGHNEWQNLALVQFLCQSIDKKLGREEGTSEKLITFVTDRKGHDRRYAIDASKLKDKLGWEPQISPEEGMVKTVDWYVDNAEWLDSVTSGSYQEYYKKQYQN
mgnify:CR=1 FL=1